ncbi:hypothetical protein [Rhizobium paknamense]|uniref:Outer membrane murein-binding lipoprotein Lpp n=1 Tax=Rhizobium paknamense TaxID=1206817 RepID=A0ABU0IG47_9HYPH|nr:hypothetical protein [Rhizobium paknamense]MDQ0457240.1 outer membrane murein-binding lipoprotein Lpp [Rhizobium paknamense]
MRATASFNDNKSAMRVAMVIAGLAVMAGCSSTSQTTPPPARNASLKVKVAGEADGARPGAAYITPDGYPDFSRPLTAANVQMTNSDASDLEKKLTALSQMRSAGRISEAEYNRRVQEMRKLAADQGAATVPPASK